MSLRKCGQELGACTSLILLQEMSVQSSRGPTEKWEKGEEGQRRYQAGMGVVASTEERRKGEGQDGDKLFKRKKEQDGNMARTKSIPVGNPGVSLQVWA